MDTAGRIYEAVKTLSEQNACEILSFVEKLKAKHIKNEHSRKALALAKLAKYRGCVTAEKFNREDCYDR